MKKTFRFLSMAALLVVGAIMTGCSNDDNIDNPQQPANKDNVVTLTATVGFEANAETRAVDPSTGKKTFEGTNQIAVIYKNTSNETVKAVSTVFTPTGDNTTATFTVSLTNPASDGAIRYIYPATMAKTPATDATITDDAATIDYSGILSSQKGDLTSLGTNYDLAVFDGSLSGTDLPASATLTNPLAICKFTLTDGTNPVSVNSLTISDGTNAYTVKPTSALSEVYVAMKPVTGANINFTANAGSTNYTKTATGKTLAASNLYPITVPMTEAFSLATPLTLEAITAGTITVDTPQPGMKYSLNGGAKTAVPDGTDIVVTAGDKVAFYGNGTSITSYNGTNIAGGTAQVKIYGNIMSLVKETGFATATTLTDFCFYELFLNYSNLKDASGLLLPATTLGGGCYSEMFSGCTSLTAAPNELPATTLAEYCYESMFCGCTSLIAAPELKATSLSEGCYMSMFERCTSLTTAPELKAETLAVDCYSHMFIGCTSLTTAPELKATSLARSCYSYMFSACTSLTATPELKATSLVSDCYYGMFFSCTSLTTAYVKAAYTDSYDECKDMFAGCSAAGAVLHTTTANKDSWDGAISSEGWSTWTAVDDWN